MGFDPIWLGVVNHLLTTKGVSICNQKFILNHRWLIHGVSGSTQLWLCMMTSLQICFWTQTCHFILHISSGHVAPTKPAWNTSAQMQVWCMLEVTEFWLFTQFFCSYRKKSINKTKDFLIFLYQHFSSFRYPDQICIEFLECLLFLKKLLFELQTWVS